MRPIEIQLTPLFVVIKMPAPKTPPSPAVPAYNLFPLEEIVTTFFPVPNKPALVQFKPELVLLKTPS